MMHVKTLTLTLMALSLICGGAAAVSLGADGCGDAKSIAVAQADKPDAAAPDGTTADGNKDAKADDAVPEKTTVKVIEVGAEPRKTLRYKFQADKKENLVMQMKVGMTQDVGGQARQVNLPAMHMVMSMVVKKVTSEGDAHIEFEFTKGDVKAGPNDQPAVVNAMQQQLRGMLGLSGTADVTPRGVTTKATVKPVPGNAVQNAQLVDEIRRSMTQLSVPFPTEAVGKGAQWKVTMPVPTPLFNVRQEIIYTLAQRKGDEVTLDFTVTQTAKPQMVNLPNAPGAKAKLELFKTSGKGTVKIKLTNLVPDSSMTSTTENVISVAGQKAKTKMNMSVKFHP